MTIGGRIKEARKRAGLTQAELASKLEIPYQSISQWERNLRRPKYETLQRIASALNVTIWELIDELTDSEYENVVNTLKSAGISIEECWLDDDSGPDGDLYYVWHTEEPEGREDRVVLPWRDIAHTVESAQRDAERRKADYLRKRLEAELF